MSQSFEQIHLKLKLLGRFQFQNGTNVPLVVSVLIRFVLSNLLFLCRIHIMSGKEPSPTSENDTAYENNLRYAAKKFESEGILGLIEPINKYSVPGYYMNNFEKGIPHNVKYKKKIIK